MAEFELYFAAFDAFDQPIRDLRKDEVEVFDKNRGPFPLTGLQHATVLPLRVAVLVDTSASVASSRMRSLQQAAFVLDLMAAAPRSMGTTLTFGQSVQRLQSWTSDTNLLRHSIQTGTWRQPDSGAGTSLFDAITTTCTYEFAHQQGSPTSKLLFILSDGLDTASHTSMLEATDACKKAQTHVFAVQPLSVEHRSAFGESVLSKIAKSTGGKLIPSTTLSDLQDSLRLVASTFTAGYVGTFHPVSNQSGNAHKLILVGSDRAKTIVVQQIWNETVKEKPKIVLDR